MMTEYVLGFMFSADFSSVALMRKEKPDWQAGRLNGVGGKMQEEEPIADAMVREFQEEAGLKTAREQWKRFAHLNGECFQVYCLATSGDVSQLKSMESEPILIEPVLQIHPLRSDMVENITWMIPLAIDVLRHGLPLAPFVAYYPNA